MSDQPQVESLGDHHYLVRTRQGEDIVEIQIRATPGVIARLAGDESDETRIIEATAAYLIARQRADDLPRSSTWTMSPLPTPASKTPCADGSATRTRAGRRERDLGTSHAGSGPNAYGGGAGMTLPRKGRP